MDRRTTWILLIVLAVLVGGVYLVMNPSTPSAPTGETTATIAPVWAINSADIVSVRIDDVMRKKYMEIRKDDAGKWFVVGYIPATPTLTPTATPSGTPSPTLTPSNTPTSTATPSMTPSATPGGVTLTPSATAAFVIATASVPTKEADEVNLGYVIGQLGVIMPIANLGEDQKPGDFQLDNPRYLLTVRTGAGMTYILEVGGQTPIANGYYVRLQGSSRIAVVPTYVIDQLVAFIDNPPFLYTPTLTPTETLTPSVTETPAATLTETPTPAPTTESGSSDTPEPAAAETATNTPNP